MGGQLFPISMLGDRLLWKNVQKNEKKKQNFRDNKKDYANLKAKNNFVSMKTLYCSF